MPLYEYYCPPCGGQFEVLRPVSQMNEPAVCPSGHTTNNRVLSLFAISHSQGDAPAATNAAACESDNCCVMDSVGGGALGHMGCSCC